jgi:WD40 repeat protein
MKEKNYYGNMLIFIFLAISTRFKPTLSSQNFTLTGHTNNVNGVAFSSDHSYLASCSSDGYLNIWNASTNWSLTRHLNNGFCNALIHLPNAKLAASSGLGFGSNIKIWDPLKQVNGPLATLTGHLDEIFCLALSPDGSLLASGSNDFTAKIWNYTNQTTALKTFSGHTDRVNAVCFVSNQILASGSIDNLIKIWNLISGKKHSWKFFLIQYFVENNYLKFFFCSKLSRNSIFLVKVLTKNM